MPKVSMSPTARSTPFDSTGTTFLSSTKDVQTAILETRKRQIQNQLDVNTTLNGTHNVMTEDPTALVVKGTATGFTVKLEQASQIPDGLIHDIYNQSSQPFLIKDYNDTTLANVLPGDRARATLLNGGSENWFVTVISSIASGVKAFNITSDTTFSTSSPTDTFITGMTLTPEAGTYGVWYSSDIEISQNNKIADFVLYKNTSPVENTRRNVHGVGSNFNALSSFVGIVNVNGSDTLNVYTNISGAATIYVYARSLLVIRLGS